MNAKGILVLNVCGIKEDTQKNFHN